MSNQAIMLKRLASEGPAPGRAAQMMLYGQFVFFSGRAAILMNHDTASHCLIRP